MRILCLIFIVNSANIVFAQELVGSYDTPGSAGCVTISGNYAYVADFSSGLQIIDISNPSSPTLAGSYDTPGDAGCVTISGNYAYVADYSSGLQIIDISNPLSPTFAESYNTSGDAYCVAISGNYVYVADDRSGLQIIDISNPSLPTLAGSYTSLGPCVGVAISGNYAYIAQVLEGLEIIDISNPSLPTFAGHYFTPGNAQSVTISDNYAYVAEHSCLEIIDISNPALPTPVTRYDTPGDAYGVAISGNYVYVADDRSGLHIIDISNPALPTPAGNYDTPGKARSVTISGNYAYVADMGSGIQILDVRNIIYNRLFINNRRHDSFIPGYINKSVLVVEPKNTFVKNSLYITYSDIGLFGGSNSELEINHFFDLPEGAVVNDLWLWMGDSVMQAQMYDVSRAQAIYDSIIAPPTRRVDPVILKKDGNHYEMSIYPYTSGDIARIKLTYLIPAEINGDTAATQVPLAMLDLNSHYVKPLGILFKENNDVTGRNITLDELPAVTFEERNDTLGYRYALAEVEDITYLSELNVSYTIDALDADSEINALMNANDNITYLFAQNSVDTAAIVDSSIHYNILTDFTALLALEPDDRFQFMVDPLDEDDFVPDPPITNIPEVSNTYLDSISFSIDPNPFSHSTEISFSLKTASRISFDVFTSRGIHVRNIFHGIKQKGLCGIKWDGCNTVGTRINKGAYIFRISIDGKDSYGKIMKF